MSGMRNTSRINTFAAKNCTEQRIYILIMHIITRITHQPQGNCTEPSMYITPSQTLDHIFGFGSK